LKKLLNSAISVSAMNDLENRILKLEQVHARQMSDLKDSAASIVDSISPANLLKSALKDVVQSPDLRNSAINTAIGIGVGFLGKKLFVGNSKNIFKKVSGSAVQFLIANFVRNKIPGLQKNNQDQSHEN
jgi:hypothetical protein